MADEDVLQALADMGFGSFSADERTDGKWDVTVSPGIAPTDAGIIMLHAQESPAAGFRRALEKAPSLERPWALYQEAGGRSYAGS